MEPRLSLTSSLMRLCFAEAIGKRGGREGHRVQACSVQGEDRPVSNWRRVRAPKNASGTPPKSTPFHVPRRDEVESKRTRRGVPVLPPATPSVKLRACERSGVSSAHAPEDFTVNLAELVVLECLIRGQTDGGRKRQPSTSGRQVLVIRMGLWARWPKGSRMTEGQNGTRQHHVELAEYIQHLQRLESK